MDFAEIDRFIDRAGAQAVIAATASSITDMRRARIERVLHGRLSSIEVALECPEDPRNAAAVVRTSEALGIMRVHVIDAAPGALDHRWVTQGASYWVHTCEHAALASLTENLGERSMRLAGAVMDGAFDVEELPVEGPICILFGNEGTGLTRSALSLCDIRFRVPMVGMSESLNLSVSAAITLHSLTRRRRRLLGLEGELRGAAYLREKARFYARSVEPRYLTGCFGP